MGLSGSWLLLRCLHRGLQQKQISHALAMLRRFDMTRIFFTSFFGKYFVPVVVLFLRSQLFCKSREVKHRYARVQ